MDYPNSIQELHSQSLISEERDFKQVENVIAYQKDVEYMKQLLPSALQSIQMEIDEECDRLEYSGSVMFDEYPDKNYVHMIVDKIMHRLTDAEQAEGELSSQSLESDSLYTPSYCPDDAMQDCEKDITLETTALEGSGRRGWYGPGGSPGWFPPPNPWRPPHGGWDGRRCSGPFCPLGNRRCGNGRWCPPVPFGDFDRNGKPFWQRHLVENMLLNEMMYRRSRYRNHNL